MTDRPDNEHEEETPKFKIVDKRRIDVDDVEPADEVEEEPEPVEPPPAKEEPSEEPESEPEEPEPEDDVPPQFKMAPGADQDAQEAMKPEEDPLTYMNILLSFLQTLISVAYVRMGMVAHPQTRLIAKDMEEARKIIDMYEVLYNHGSAAFPEQVTQELERVLQDLKVNYVNNL